MIIIKVISTGCELLGESMSLSITSMTELWIIIFIEMVPTTERVTFVTNQYLIFYCELKTQTKLINQLSPDEFRKWWNGSIQNVLCWQPSQTHLANCEQITWSISKTKPEQEWTNNKMMAIIFDNQIFRNGLLLKEWQFHTYLNWNRIKIYININLFFFLEWLHVTHVPKM